jgi:hypothetical protein
MVTTLAPLVRVRGEHQAVVVVQPDVRDHASQPSERRDLAADKLLFCDVKPFDDLRSGNFVRHQSIQIAKTETNKSPPPMPNAACGVKCMVRSSQLICGLA